MTGIRSFVVATAVAAGMGCLITSTFAGELKSPVKAVIAQNSGLYLWTDGSYQSIRTPTYDLGFRLVPAGATNGPAASFDPRVTGYGISGGIGFILPSGMFLSNIGTNARIEFGGSYVNAKASQAGAISSPGTSVGALPQLNGVTPFSTGCGLGCISTSSLSSDYSSWRANGKFLTDYRVNGVTLTPSLMLFGGKSRNNQTLSDRITFVGVATFDQYDARTSLDWTDWGIRVGLSGSVAVTDWITFAAGGNVGLAARRASLTGSDSSFASIIPGVINVSSISTGQTTTPFLANAEASLAFRLARAWSLRAFVGLDYDSKVPGIAAPTVVAGGGTSTAAGIKFQSETSYYAGGGLTIEF
jgi:hypothetical protein